MGKEPKKPVQMQMLVTMYTVLKRIARANRRSMGAQALVYVEAGLEQEQATQE